MARALIGQSKTFQEQIRRIPLIANCAVPVLVTGETGTGKEVVARAIHSQSPRADGPFVPVNCGAIPTDLVENEIFGHERGAFTGANRASPGLAEQAAGGTLFLDEVDNLPLLAQVKLLRFLQEKEFRRLGSVRVQQIDVRVIAATNADVEAAVERGALRSDLYYRLNVLSLQLPPLRCRREDIPLLANHFLELSRQRFLRAVDGFEPAAMESLVRHDWPGNVRELDNVVQRATLLCEGSRIARAHVQLLRSQSPEALTFKEAKARVVKRFERAYLKTLLLAHQGNITHASRAAGKHRRAFWELMRKHRIDARSLAAGLSDATVTEVSTATQPAGARPDTASDLRSSE